METLHSKKISGGPSGTATQQFLDVAEVKENVIVLKNGSFRSVLAVSAINFELKSTEEQEAIVSQYQNFLNSLDFPLQILINSRKLNIEKYLDFMSKQEKKQPNELLRLQIYEYKNFVQQLISVSNIMNKKFFIVIPFYPTENEQKGFFGNISARLNPKKNIIEKRETFETYKSQLLQRAGYVFSGLSGLGLKIAPLQTQELVEFLYNSYNPNIFEIGELKDVSALEL